MMGSLEDEKNQGIIPRINKKIFSIIKNNKRTEIIYSVKVSIIEISNENIKVKACN